MGLYLVTPVCILLSESHYPLGNLILRYSESLPPLPPPPPWGKDTEYQVAFSCKSSPFVSINYHASKFHFDKEKCWFTQKVACLVEKSWSYNWYCFVHQMNLLRIDNCHRLLSASSSIAIFQQIRKLIWCFVSFLRAILSAVSSESLIGAVFESKKYRDGKI